MCAIASTRNSFFGAEGIRASIAKDEGGTVLSPQSTLYLAPALALSVVEGSDRWPSRIPACFPVGKKNPPLRRGRAAQKGPRGERACPRGLFQRLSRDYSFSGLLGSGVGADFGSGLLVEGCF